MVTSGAAAAGAFHSGMSGVDIASIAASHWWLFSLGDPSIEEQADRRRCAEMHLPLTLQYSTLPAVLLQVLPSGEEVKLQRNALEVVERPSGHEQVSFGRGTKRP